jgi:glycosyltransferase involved in cell wall biosynthesis
MKQIISALIVDKNYKKHDYKDIYLKNTPRYIEEKFDIKVLENCDNILYELDKNRGIDCLITIGDVDTTPLMGVTYEIRKKWIHLEKYDSIEISNAIIDVFVNNVNRDREVSKVFSVFTPMYNTSEDMIKRLYNSLTSQTYTNWNWWILDDSDDDKTIEKVKSLNDPRIFIFKNVSNHGCIGFNKHMIAMMCDGDYLVEVDHDDELTNDCFSKLYECFDISNADFVYSDALEYIDGNSISYGDYFSYGQGYYREEVVNGRKYVIPITTSSINAKSIRGIHAMPNHVRCWKREFYHQIGGHNTELSVIDDMELITRTFLYGKMAKVNKVLYIQHEGESGKDTNNRGNTTTGHRFKEIQRVNNLMYRKYDKEVHNRILELGFEDPVWDEENDSSNIHKDISLDELPIMDVLIIE